MTYRRHTEDHDDHELQQRLRQDMAEAMAQVQTPTWLAAAAARGGRQRARRRRTLTTALITAPIAVAAAAAVVAGSGRTTGWFGPAPSPQGGQSAVAATPAPSASPSPSPSPSPSTTAFDPAALTAERAAAAAAATEELAQTQLEAQHQQWAADLTAEGKPELAAYFGAGYDYDDALTLGQRWNVDPSEAKVTAGADLMAGEVLPVTPSPDVPKDSPGWEITAFAAAGYTVDDATRLGQLLGLDEWNAQVEGGRRLLAGEVLPFAPGAAPTATGGLQN